MYEVKARDLMKEENVYHIFQRCCPKIVRRSLFNVACIRQINFCLRTVVNKRILIPIVGKVEITLPDGAKFDLNSDGTDMIAARLYCNGLDGMEPESIKLYYGLLDLCDIVLDIGANIGLYSLIAGCKNKQVYAFEPVPTIYQKLKENIKINNFKNIVPLNEAITEENKKVKLYIPKTTRAIPTEASLIKSYEGETDEITVLGRTLDKFVDEYNINKVDFIKMDTEATEDKVLKGAQTLILRDKPLILCEVLPNKIEKELNNFFKNTDYKYYMISEEGLIEKKRIEGEMRNPNYLFIPKTKEKNVLDFIANTVKIIHLKV